MIRYSLEHLRFLEERILELQFVGWSVSWQSP